MKCTEKIWQRNLHKDLLRELRTLSEIQIKSPGITNGWALTPAAQEDSVDDEKRQTRMARKKERILEVISSLLGNGNSYTADLSNIGHARGKTKSCFFLFHEKWFTNYYSMKRLSKNKEQKEIEKA